MTHSMSLRDTTDLIISKLISVAVIEFLQTDWMAYSKHYNIEAEQKRAVQDVMLFNQSNAITDAIVQSEGLKSMTS